MFSHVTKFNYNEVVLQSVLVFRLMSLYSRAKKFGQEFGQEKVLIRFVGSCSRGVLLILIILITLITLASRKTFSYHSLIFPLPPLVLSSGQQRATALHRRVPLGRS